MKVYLSYEDKKYEKQVESFLDIEIATNCNLNGAEYVIEYDDFTWIDGINGSDDIILMRGIFNLIEELKYV